MSPRTSAHVVWESAATRWFETTGDSGPGAKLGEFKSRVNGIGPILTYTLGDPRNPLTFIGKYYQEFDAKNTFEGRSFDITVTLKF